MTHELNKDNSLKLVNILALILFPLCLFPAQAFFSVVVLFEIFGFRYLIVKFLIVFQILHFVYIIKCKRNIIHSGLILLTYWVFYYFIIQSQYIGYFDWYYIFFGLPLIVVSLIYFLIVFETVLKQK